MKAAAEHLRKHGVQRACADFMDKDGGLVRGEHCVVLGCGIYRSEQARPAPAAEPLATASGWPRLGAA